MQEDEQPHWVGFCVQQELANEQLVAEMIREVYLTLRSRAVSHTLAMIEAYHTASELVKQLSEQRSPLARVTTTLHIFCLALSPRNALSLSPASDDAQNPETPAQEQGDGLPQKRARSRRHPRTSSPKMPQASPSFEELHTMPYHEYLQTLAWQARRKKKLKQAGNRCQICNTNQRRVDVHHRTYERRGYELDEDLTVLCEDCHALFHQRLPKFDADDRPWEVFIVSEGEQGSE